MTPGELDAGKPPVQFDEGQSRAVGTDNYGRFNHQTRLCLLY